jgi:hypothetical protein
VSQDLYQSKNNIKALDILFFVKNRSKTPNMQFIRFLHKCIDVVLHMKIFPQRIYNTQLKSKTYYMKSKFLLLFLSAIVMNISPLSAQLNQATTTIGAGTNQIDLTVTVNSQTSTVIFSMTGPATKWFGIGFAATSMSSGSYGILANVSGGNPQEYSIQGQTTPSLQSTQNLGSFSSSTTGGRKTYTFSRSMTTGDANDYTFPTNASTINIIWAYGSSTSLSYHASRGMSSLSFANPCNIPVTNLSPIQICSGTSAVIFGTSQSQAGTYYDTLSGSGGCDSVISQQLIVNAPIVNTLPALSICQGDSIMIFGQYYHQAGTYTDTVSTAGGCDSVLSQQLSINPPIVNTLPALSICQGDSIMIFGQYYNQAGTYTDTVSTAGGCDSVLIQPLTVSAPVTNNLPALQICQGDSVMIFGQYYSQATTIADTLMTSLGCDSILSQQLLVSQPTQVTLPALSICQGDSAMIFGQYYSTAGTYHDTIPGTGSTCDSLFSQQLIVGQHASFQLPDTSICYGDSLMLFGHYQSTTGSYYDTIPGTGSSCDSVVWVNLTVLPMMDTSVTNNGLTLTSNQLASSYQWYECATNQPINGATSMSYSPTQTGLYKVEITVGSCTAMSDCHQVVISSMNIVQVPSFKLSPNPAKESLLIRTDDMHRYQIELLDLQGKIIRMEQVVSNRHQMDVSSLQRGMYIVILRNMDTQLSSRQRFIKQ